MPQTPERSAKRVALVGLRTIGAYPGGVEAAVSNVLPYLAEAGWEIDLFVRARYWQPTTLPESVRLSRIAGLYGKHSEAISHTLLATIVAGARRTPVVHYHAIGNGLLSWAPKVWGGRSVVTVHGRDWQRAKWGRMARVALRMAERVSIRCATATAAVSRSLTDDLAREYGAHIHYTPNAVSLRNDTRGRLAASASVYEALDITPGKYFFWIGRIVPEKRLDLLIGAFRCLRTDMQLVIAGTQGHTPDHERAVRAQAAGDPRIRFVGPRFGADKEALFCGAACFVLPSDLEGMPIAMLEALGYRVPVVASALPELSEFFTPPSRVVWRTFKPGSLEQLAARLKEFASAPDAARVEVVDLEPALLEWASWERVAASWISLYEKVLHAEAPNDGGTADYGSRRNDRSPASPGS